MRRIDEARYEALARGLTFDDCEQLRGRAFRRILRAADLALMIHFRDAAQTVAPMRIGPNRDRMRSAPRLIAMLEKSRGRISGKSGRDIDAHRFQIDRVFTTIRDDRAHDRSLLVPLDEHGNRDAILLDADAIERQVQRASAFAIAISQFDPVRRHRV